MSKKRQHSKSTRPPMQPAMKAGDPILRELKLCADAQHSLTRTIELMRHQERQRRETIRRAFAAGATASDIADAVQVSRAKIYQLLGSARALKA